MTRLNRRDLIVAGAGALVAGRASAQPQDHAHHAGQYERLNAPGRIPRPPLAETQAVFESPIPRAADPGGWSDRAPLPLPRSEMAWAAADAEGMHIVGGYAEQQVNRPYHQVYRPADDRWVEQAPLPLGANHVGVAFLEGRLYAIGGFVEQNARPHPRCFVWEARADRWTEIAPLPRALGSGAVVGLNGVLHCIGGAIGDSGPTKKSIDWHWVYDPAADGWSERRAMPTGRDHTGTVVIGDKIHVIGGRVDNFHTNSNLHHAYDPATDAWTFRNPLPTARSGHGAVLYRGKVFVMGGEGTNRVHAQMEAYDPVADAWEQYAPMKTPRHGLGAALVGDAIHVAGGGPIVGGGVQSAVHEAFALG